MLFIAIFKNKAIAAGMEPAWAVRRRNCLKSTLYRVRKSIQGPCLEFTKERLHRRPELFNRIQIRTIWWKINVSNTGAVQQISHCLCMVRLHIIHHKDRIAVKLRQQNILQKVFLYFNVRLCVFARGYTLLHMFSCIFLFAVEQLKTRNENGSFCSFLYFIISISPTAK